MGMSCSLRKEVRYIWSRVSRSSGWVFPFGLSALTQSAPSSASTNNSESGNKNVHLHGEMWSDNSSEIRGWNSQSNMALCFLQRQVRKFKSCSILESKTHFGGDHRKKAKFWMNCKFVIVTGISKECCIYRTFTFHLYFLRFTSYVFFPFPCRISFSFRWRYPN